MEELSKSDRVGCFITELGNAISELDNQFANAEGHIEINDFNEVIRLIGFLYSRFKTAYEDCLGKNFTISVPGVGGKIIELLLELLTQTTGNGTPKAAPESTTP